MSTSDADAAIAPFDVIVVPFPYSERLAEKRRPALVISNARLHRERRAGDVAIRDLAAARLPGASIVRAAKIATIEPERIVRRIGTLAKGERAVAMKAVAGFLGT